MRHPERQTGACAMMPEPRRVAIHQAGHAVVQTLVGRRRCAVVHVSLDGEHDQLWRGLPARGESRLDREIETSLYEFGLMTLAGIAAEDRYMALGESAAEPVVALSDLAEWQERAWDILRDDARVRLVSLNVMRKLEEWLREDSIWRVVERLAEELLAQGTVEGQELERILAPLLPRCSQ